MSRAVSAGMDGGKTVCRVGQLSQANEETHAASRGQTAAGLGQHEREPRRSWEEGCLLADRRPQ